MNEGNSRYSDYIIFADESGDHSLSSINPIYPIFVLCFCLMRKDYYVEKMVPEVHKIKMRYFGHDQVVFHERDFVKRKGIIGSLNDSDRNGLISDINDLITNAEMHIIASVIDKYKLKEKYLTPFNPYHLALQFCLERTYDYISPMFPCDDANGRITHIVAESRGKEEDKSLKEEFRHIVAGSRNWGRRNVPFNREPLELYCAPKGANSSGMQIADLTARPIGLSRLRPSQSNRAFEIIEGKIWDVKDFP